MKTRKSEFALVLTFSSVINPRKGCAQQSLNGVFYMKKNVLALSISAALCGLGMVGSAYAITDLGVAASVGAATQLKGNNDGVGHNLIVPYYTAQGKNATAFTLTNTTAQGKAVKVRFRGAENSDDVLDFQVFLSPYDVWTASVSQAATGEAMITTTDKSCTKPAFTSGTGVNFRTGRLSAATNVAGTREGYIEIFNMADVTGTVLTAITHTSAGVPKDCAAAAFTALDTDMAQAAYVGLALPTTGLVANYIIINTTTGTSWSGQAAATQALTAAGAPTTGNLVYWPQMATGVGVNVSGWTADPLLTGVTPIVTPTMQDLPDMSTPYISGLAPTAGVNFNAAGAYVAAANDQWAAKVQASKLTTSLAVTGVNNDFYVETGIGGATDWVFTMPTRRYNAAVKYSTTSLVFTDYTKTDTAVPGTVVAAAPAAALPNLNYFDATNSALSGSVICVSGLTPTMYNGEEGTADGSSVTFSPSTVITASFCGEAGVWALGQTLAAGGSTNVLSSGIANVAQGVSVNNFAAGWLNVATAGLGGRGLPVVGASFSKASSDPAKTYGWSQPHTSSRIAGFVY
jgi:hypothetical protein